MYINRKQVATIIALSIYSFSVGGVCFATPPSINSSSVLSISHKQTTSVAGANFGKKIPAAPLRYIDFEEGTLGAQVPNAETSGGLYTAAGVIYDNTYQRVPGTKNALQQFTDGRPNQVIGLDQASTMNSNRLYMHGYWRFQQIGPLARNAKFLNLYYDYGGTTTEWVHRIGMTNTSCSNTGSMAGAIDFGCPTTGLREAYWPGWTEKFLGRDNLWHRIDSYIDTEAAFRWLNIDNEERFYTRTQDQTVGCSVRSVGQVYFGHFYSNDTCAVDGQRTEAKRWWDEIYIDITQARVEICDAALWSVRSHCEIQIPSAWSPSSITLTVNQGSFINNAEAYIFVINESGEVSAGQKVVFSPTDALAANPYILRMSSQN